MTVEERVDKLWGDLFGEAPALYKSVFRQDKRDIITKAIEDVVAEEREACAKVAESHATHRENDLRSETAGIIAAAIRGRK